MTEEEIAEVRRNRRKAYDREYRKTDKGKEAAKRAYQKRKERFRTEPVYREQCREKWRKKPEDRLPAGKPFTMSENTRKRIEHLYAKGKRVSVIAKLLEQPYPRVYMYIKNHIKNRNKTYTEGTKQ